MSGSRNLPKVVGAMLAPALLLVACSGGSSEDGLGPEAPGVTVPSTQVTTTIEPGSGPTSGQGATTQDATSGTATTSDPETAQGATTAAPPGSPTTSTTTGPGVATTGAPAATSSTTTTTVVIDPEVPAVHIGPEDYRFTIAECLFYDGVDVEVHGPGEASDGTPVYVTMAIDQVRIDIGTDQPEQGAADHWLAGAGAYDDLEVAIDGSRVIATGTFVRQPGAETVHGSLAVDCPLG